jgi:hypothetical protein
VPPSPPKPAANNPTTTKSEDTQENVDMLRSQTVPMFSTGKNSAFSTHAEPGRRKLTTDIPPIPSFEKDEDGKKGGPILGKEVEPPKVTAPDPSKPV